MAQSDFESLVLDLDYEFTQLSDMKELLDIGVEQLDIERDKTVERLVLLLGIISQSLDCRIENIEHMLKRLHVYSDVARIS